MLQDEIGSIMNFCYNQNPVKVYTNRIPQNMVIPSMYFPVPIVISAGDTITTYRNSYHLFVKVFAVSSQQAHLAAHSIAETLRQRRCVIPVIALDGTYTGKYMKLNPDIQTKELDDGVAQLTLKWHSRYPYERDVVEYMETLNQSRRLKGE